MEELTRLLEVSLEEPSQLSLVQEDSLVEALKVQEVSSVAEEPQWPPAKSLGAAECLEEAQEWPQEASWEEWEQWVLLAQIFLVLNKMNLKQKETKICLTFRATTACPNTNNTQLLCSD